MPKSYSPEVKSKGIAMYEAGYTALFISEQLDVPLPTLKSWFSKNGVKSGFAKQMMIDKARDELLSQLSKQAVDQRIASLMAEDAILSAQIRVKMLDALSQIDPTDNASAALALRAITAASTALKNTSDAQRGFLLNRQAEAPKNDLPTLCVTELSNESLQKILEDQSVGTLS